MCVTSQFVPLHARTYGRQDGLTVVRLIAEPLIEAEDRILDAVGVVRQDSAPDIVVGSTAVPAADFPTWPIAIDPANTHQALDLVGDLEWARRAVQSRPKEVAKRFAKITTELTASAPHFLPMPLEELKRLYADHGEDVLARRTFSQAREVERPHNIPVDPERHRAMFVEFAGLGVITPKSSLPRSGPQKDASRIRGRLWTMCCRSSPV